MHMGGEERIAAPRDRVWAALNDPEVLKPCIPGCESLERVSETELHGVVNAKVGPVQARFKGVVTLSEIDPPNGYRIAGEGKGGAAGFARGGATVRLTAEGEGDSATLLSYDVDAKVGGKLAQVGQRLVDQSARKMAADFFARFNRAVAGPEPASQAAGNAEVATAPPDAASQGATSEGVAGGPGVTGGTSNAGPAAAAGTTAAPSQAGRRRPPQAFWLALFLALFALVLYLVAL